MKIREWLDKGDGGEWYEPYVTNGDCVYIWILTLIGSGIIMGGCLLIRIYN